MKRFLSIILAALMLLALFTAPAMADDLPVLGFVVPGDNTWRSMYRQSFADYCEILKAEGKIKDYYVYACDTDESVLNALNDCINKGVDYLSGTLESSAFAPTLLEAHEMGIKLILSTNLGLDIFGDDAIILTQDNETYMSIPMEYLAEKAGYDPNTEVTYLWGVDGGWDGQEVRKKGVYSIADKYGMKVAHTGATGWDIAETTTQMSTILSAYGQQVSDGIIFAEDTALGVLQACKAANLEPKLVAGDYTYGFLREWAKNYPNTASLSTNYSPYIGANVAMAMMLMEEGYKLNTEVCNGPSGDEPYHLVLPMPCVVVDEYNENDKWLEFKDPSTEVWLLDEVLADADARGASDADCYGTYMSFEEFTERYWIAP